MLPPRPPSPPEGPPRGTYFSRRKATQPLPPSPAFTRIFASSINIVVSIEKASTRRRGSEPPETRSNGYSASTGSTMTYLPIDPRSLNLIRPVIFAKRVSSFPRPTFSPGFTRVPRCRTMMVPPGTSCPPNALNPRRCALESRPFRDVPCPFLCAIKPSPQSLFVRGLLLLRGRFPGRGLPGRFLFGRLGSRVFRFGRRGRLLRLWFLLREFRRLERLAVVGDLGDADRAEGLAVSTELFVLLLPLVVEDDDFGAASFLDDFAQDPGFARRADDLALGC